MKVKVKELKKELRALGLKTYRNNRNESFVRKGDVKRILAAFQAKEKSQTKALAVLMGRNPNLATADVKDKLKEFLKKAVVPALMMLGPVACGVQEGEGPSKAEINNIEKDINVGLEKKVENLQCSVKVHDDGSSTVTFTGRIKTDKGYTKDSLVFEFDGIADDETELDITQHPETEPMEVFQEILLESISEVGKTQMEKDYSCSLNYGKSINESL